MNKGLFSVLLLIFSFGCSPKDIRYHDIDFIAYSWRTQATDHEPHFYCTTYALIDNTGQCEFIVEGYSPKTERRYCKINIDKNIINKLLETATHFQKESDFRPSIINIYDGPDLKIKINYKGNDWKTMHFYDNDSEKSKEFIQLYKLISSSFMSKSYQELKDTGLLAQRRRAFIADCMKSHYPSPIPDVVQQRKK